MWVLGTSAVKYLSEKAPSTAIQSALAGKLVAYVGTINDLFPPSGDTYTPPASSQFSVFFALPALAGSGNEHTVAPLNAQTVATLYIVINNAWDNTAVGTLDYIWITDYMLPASGLTNAIYQFQRGNEADIGSAYAVPGTPFFAKDMDDLWVHNGIEWRKVATPNAWLGMMIPYPENLSIPAAYTEKYLWADGATLTAAEITKYPDFAALILNKFGTGYIKPFQNNTLIRVVI